MDAGRQHWTISNGWIPPLGDETVGFLNVSDEEAHVQIFIYYRNRDPVGPYRLTVPAKRIHRVRFNCLTDPEPIARATDYAGTIDSDAPIVVQPCGDAFQETLKALWVTGNECR